MMNKSTQDDILQNLLMMKTNDNIVFTHLQYNVSHKFFPNVSASVNFDTSWDSYLRWFRTFDWKEVYKKVSRQEQTLGTWISLLLHYVFIYVLFCHKNYFMISWTFFYFHFHRLSLPAFFLCTNWTVFIGSGSLFVVAVLWGLMSLGKK